MRLRMMSVVGMVAGVAVLVWATLPPRAVAVDESCQPLGGPARLSALLYPGPFWRTQLEAVLAERDDLLAQPARRARLAAEAEREAREAPGIESRMMRLSREDTQIDPEAQDRRASAEQAARLRRLSWLIGCAETISARR